MKRGGFEHRSERRGRWRPPGHWDLYVTASLRKLSGTRSEMKNFGMAFQHNRFTRSSTTLMRFTEIQRLEGTSLCPWRCWRIMREQKTYACFRGAFETSVLYAFIKFRENCAGEIVGRKQKSVSSLHVACTLIMRVQEALNKKLFDAKWFAQILADLKANNVVGTPINHLESAAHYLWNLP